MVADLVLHISAESLVLSAANGRREWARQAGLPEIDSLLDRAWHLRDQMSRRADRPRLDADVSDPVVALGRELGRAVLSGAVGGALGEAASPGEGLRLGLVVDELRLADLPWELMIAPGQPTALALDPKVLVYRLDAAWQSSTRPAIFRRVLFVHASGSQDEAGTALAVEHERALVVDALQRAGGRIALRSLEEAAPEAIGAALRPGDHQILHLSCHATPGDLILEDDNGRPLRVPAERLATVLPTNHAVRLVVLAGCSTALSTSTPGRPADLLDDQPALAGIARTLSGSGVDYVIAMSAAVSDACAQEFAANFYSALAAGASVVASVAAARRVISSMAGDLGTEWAKPVVYCRQLPEPDGEVAGVVAAPEPLLRHRPVIGRRSERRRLLGALSSPAAAAVLYGLPGTGKTALIGEIARGLADEGMTVAFLAGRLSARAVLDSLPAPDGLLVCDDFEHNLTTNASSRTVMDPELAGALAAVRSRGGRLLLSSRVVVDDLPTATPVALGPMSDAETRQLLLTSAAPHRRHRWLIDDGRRFLGGHPGALIEFADNSEAAGEVLQHLLGRSGLSKIVSALTPEIRSLLVHIAVHAVPASEDALPSIEVSGLSPDQGRRAGLEQLERLGLAVADFRGYRCPRWMSRWLSATYPEVWKQANLFAGSYLWYAGPGVNEMTSAALEQARRHYRVAGLPRMAALIAGHLQRRHRQAGDTEAERLVCLDALIDMSADDADRRAFEQALGDIGLLRGQLPEARTAFQKVLEAGRSFDHPEQVATALHRLGVIARDSGDNLLALDYFQQMEALQAGRGDESGRATALHLKGMANESLGNLTQARDDLDEALRIKRLLGDRVLLANTLDALGSLHHDLGDHDMAITRFRECLTLDRATNNIRGEAETLAALAGAYWGRGGAGDVDRAAEYARLAVTRAQAVGLPRATAKAWHVLGMVAQAQGRGADAQVYYQHVLAAAEKGGDPVNVLAATGQLSNLAREAGHRDEAIRLARQVVTMAENLHDRLSLTRAHLCLGLMHAQAASEYRDRARYLVAREHLTKTLALAERHGYDTFAEDSRNLLTMVAQDLSRRF